ncbi:hypothetical protein THOG11_50302 [Vibrio harveyi]|nr:hypothetical protein TH15OA1_480227 [Vibrio harveyi]CAH1581696.1 hypothetical protein THOG11_50302 [Vibrio harveyi]
MPQRLLFTMGVMVQVVIEKSDAVDFAIVSSQYVMNHAENRDLNREYRIVGGEYTECK